MSDSVYLYYRNNDYQLKKFTYNTIIPFLWQELLSVELLENETKQIPSEHSVSKDSSIHKISIPIETGLKNLEIRIRSVSSETPTKKELRQEFFDFLKQEVAPNTFLEIDFEGLIALQGPSEKIISDLMEFQIDHKKRFKYQKEKVSFRSVGYNPEFESFSSIYSSIVQEDKIHEEVNSKRHQNLIDDKELKKELNKKADIIFLFSFSFLLAISGVLLYILTLYRFIGIIIIILSIGIALFTYGKKYKANSDK